MSMQVHPPGNKHTILTSHADNEGSCIREEQGCGESLFLPLNFILIPKFKNCLKKKEKSNTICICSGKH